MLKKLWDKFNSTLPSGYEPSEDETFMSFEQQLYFRKKLEKWRAELMAESAATLEHLKNPAHAPDIADRATQEAEQTLELRERDRQRKLIAKIEQALKRIENGTYGYCEETGKPIGLKRLIARPIATMTLEAQEKHERDEKSYNQD